MAEFLKDAASWPALRARWQVGGLRRSNRVSFLRAPAKRVSGRQGIRVFRQDSRASGGDFAIWKEFWPGPSLSLQRLLVLLPADPARLTRASGVRYRHTLDIAVVAVAVVVVAVVVAVVAAAVVAAAAVVVAAVACDFPPISAQSHELKWQRPVAPHRETR